ncbi:Protein SQD-1 a [Aphelenchoides avenae]|nr:Protein SQD-1 a [Aphelenchus avenae]
MGAQENVPAQETVEASTDSTAIVENVKDTNFKGNEDRKIFVGGIAYDVTNEDLSSYFGQYGEVAQAQVKFDRATGRSRGFAFVEFATAEACKNALAQREQQIKNKQVEVKPAKSRENKKVFVGGLPSDFSEEELRAHFEEFGKVEDIEWPFDKQTKARRNFAFIVFEEEEAADRAAATPKQKFGVRECDVKKAVPQGKRFNNLARGMGGMRPGGYGAGYPNSPMGATQWYNATNGWSQMGALPYAAATGSAGGWGDWYSGAAGYYAHSAGNSTPYSSYSGMSSNGYDYSHAAVGAGNRPANGSTPQNQRYQSQY